jgi:hypothetical protein
LSVTKLFSSCSCPACVFGPNHDLLESGTLRCKKSMYNIPINHESNIESVDDFLKNTKNMLLVWRKNDYDEIN